MSCASCHLQALAFTDGRGGGWARPESSTPAARSSSPTWPGSGRLTWANSVIPGLEHQALGPMLGQDPVELGLSGLDEAVAAQARRRSGLSAPLPRRPSPADVPAVGYPTIVKALAAFRADPHLRELALRPLPARRDRGALAGGPAGPRLFFSDWVGCAKCHSGFAFSDAAAAPGEAGNPYPFHDIGLYQVDASGGYPPEGAGLAALTARAEDLGRFRTPPLRNVAVTAPFMHDGSVGTLGDVVDLFAAGGRARLRTGAPSPLQSELVRPFTLAGSDREDLVAFLEALTDEHFLTDPRFSDPFAP